MPDPLVLAPLSRVRGVVAGYFPVHPGCATRPGDAAGAGSCADGPVHASDRASGCADPARGVLSATASSSALPASTVFLFTESLLSCVSPRVQ